jgi:REP element-mobilizing transposase RayT
MLTPQQALWASASFVGTARKHSWRIPRAAVMANHVHIVVMDCPDDGESVRRIFKGTSQATLSEKQGRNQRWWTTGGSGRYLHTDHAIEGAIRYVAEQEWKLAEIIDMNVTLVGLSHRSVVATMVH